ncbi:hypothetical protein HK405_000677, partial [Cladochytrium tenue]
DFWQTLLASTTSADVDMTPPESAGLSAADFGLASAPPSTAPSPRPSPFLSPSPGFLPTPSESPSALAAHHSALRSTTNQGTGDIPAATASPTSPSAHPVGAGRPYFCRVGGCARSYKNLNGLKYHARTAHPGLDFRADIKGKLRLATIRSLAAAATAAAAAAAGVATGSAGRGVQDSDGAVEGGATARRRAARPRSMHAPPLPATPAVTPVPHATTLAVPTPPAAAPPSVAAAAAHKQPRPAHLRWSMPADWSTFVAATAAAAAEEDGDDDDDAEADDEGDDGGTAAWVVAGAAGITGAPPQSATTMTMPPIPPLPPGGPPGLFWL